MSVVSKSQSKTKVPFIWEERISMNDNERKAKILRFAQLAMAAGSGKLTPEGSEEMAKLKRELGMSHNLILELAAKNFINEEKDGC